MSIVVMDHAPGPPSYATADAAGLDLRAAVDVVLAPGQRVLVPTGIALGLPAGFEGQVRPRSGLALKHGVTVLNSPGTIDADYRGEVKILLVNLGADTVRFERGERVAQLVVAPVTRAHLIVVPSLEATERGAGGFGSSGTR